MRGTTHQSNMRDKRKALGMSQETLSRMTGISSSALSQIEGGWRYPFPGWQLRIAKALKAKVDELFSSEE